MSQETRKCTFASVSQPGSAKTVFTNASIRSELYSQFPEIEALGVNMKAWIKNGDDGYGLDHNSSKLPEGDFLLYFLVNKNDSGN